MKYHKRRLAAAAASFLLLQACGGGGGGGGGDVGSTPPPPPPPAPPAGPTNSNIANLVANQGFATDATTTSVAIDLNSRTTAAGTTASQTLTVTYDAAAKSYTVSAPGRSATFLPADVQSSGQGQTRYQKGNDYLTLVTTPYRGTTSNRFVGLGFWQRNSVSGNIQQMAFDTFTYGLETSTTAVPKTGSASWTTDAFGLYTAPGQTPRTVQGSGDFTVDFAQGLYKTSTFVTQYDFLTGAEVSGGGISVESVGRLGSGNSFSGNMSYGGSLGTVAGTMTGRFYGPAGEEIGATFRADNAEGATLNGSLTGQRKANAAPASFALGAIRSDELFYSTWSVVRETANTNGAGYFVTSPVVGQTTFRADGSFTIVPPSSEMPFLTFTEADRVAASRPDVASYSKTVEGTPVRVDLYRPAAGTGVALTFANFGSWSRTTPVGDQSVTLTGYFTYGFTTPRDLLSRRTGTASYEGLAFGVAGAQGGGRYSVGGTSKFAVDFGKQSFSGSLSLNATLTGGQGATSLGTWQFAAPLSYGLLVSTPLSNGTASHPLNVINPAFFGPDGEEIAATFSIVSGAVIGGKELAISGATVAKRQ